MHRKRNAIWSVLVAMMTAVLMVASGVLPSVGRASQTASSGAQTSATQLNLVLSGYDWHYASVSWAPGTKDACYESYTLYYGSSSSGPWSEYESWTNSATTEDDANIGGGHYVMVTDTDCLGSQDSNSVFIPSTPVPTLSYTVNSPTSITLSWNNPEELGGNLYFTEYQLYRSLSGGSYSNIETFGNGGTTSYTDTGVNLASESASYYVNYWIGCHSLSSEGNSACPTSFLDSQFSNTVSIPEEFEFSVSPSSTSGSASQTGSFSLTGTTTVTSGTAEPVSCAVTVPSNYPGNVNYPESCSGTPNYNWKVSFVPTTSTNPGQYVFTFTFTATGATTQQFSFTLTVSGQSPTIVSGPSANLNPVPMGTQTTISVTATGTGTLTYNWGGSAFPPGCSNPGSVASWGCTPSSSAAGNQYAITVTVSNSYSPSATGSFTLTVSSGSTQWSTDPNFAGPRWSPTITLTVPTGLFSSSQITVAINTAILLPATGVSIPTYTADIAHYFGVTLSSTDTSVAFAVLTLQVSVGGSLGGLVPLIQLLNQAYNDTFAYVFGPLNLLPDIHSFLDQSLSLDLFGYFEGKGYQPSLFDTLATVAQTVATLGADLLKGSDALSTVATLVADIDKQINVGAGILEPVGSSGTFTPVVSFSLDDLSKLLTALSGSLGALDKLHEYQVDMILDTIGFCGEPEDVPGDVVHLAQYVLTAVDVTLDIAIPNNAFTQVVDVITTIVDPAGDTIQPSVVLSSQGPTGSPVGLNLSTGQMDWEVDGAGFVIESGNASGYGLPVSTDNYTDVIVAPSAGAQVSLDAVGPTLSVSVPYGLTVYGGLNGTSSGAAGFVTVGSIAAGVMASFSGAAQDLNATLTNALGLAGIVMTEVNGTVTVSGQSSGVTQTGSVVLQISLDWDAVLRTSVPLGPFELSFTAPQANGTSQIEIEAYGTGAVGTTALLPFVEYPVTFSELGLTPNTPWSVVLGGNTASSTGTTLAFSEPNGSYPYSVGTVPGYHATNPGNQIVVDGAPASVVLSFVPIGHKVVFKERGLPSGATWTVSGPRYAAGGVYNTAVVSPLGHPGEGLELNLSLPSGKDQFSSSVVSQAPGMWYAFSSASASSPLTVSTTLITVVLTFLPVGNATFTETGLNVTSFSAEGWCLTLTSALGGRGPPSFKGCALSPTLSSTPTSISTTGIAPGLWRYSIAVPIGYSICKSAGEGPTKCSAPGANWTKLASGTIAIGSGVNTHTANLVFLPVYERITFRLVGFPAGLVWSVMLFNYTQTASPIRIAGTAFTPTSGLNEIVFSVLQNKSAVYGFTVNTYYAETGWLPSIAAGYVQPSSAKTIVLTAIDARGSTVTLYPLEISPARPQPAGAAPIDRATGIVDIHGDQTLGEVAHLVISLGFIAVLVAARRELRKRTRVGSAPVGLRAC